jgi:16S rRNA (guanine966-N2)-methyltransferase
MTKRSNARRAPPGKIRVIAGELKGRRIAIPAGTSVRPTPDRVRETLFNWLREEVAGAHCLDLYAGTGALGIEALSRGAASVWFVEQDPILVEDLVATLDVFGLTARVTRQDVRSLLQGRPAAKIDIVFLDPPYEQPIEPLIALLPPWLAERAVVYVERSRESGLPDVPNGRWRKRDYAGAVEYGLLELQPA